MLILLNIVTLQGNTYTFDNAVGLAEEVLAVREETYQLSEIPNFAELLRGFSLQHLSFFCRVLALLVFEPEDRLPGGLNGSSDALPTPPDPEKNIAEANHAVLLSVPEALPHLVSLLRLQSLPYNEVARQALGNLPTAGDLLPFLVGVQQRDGLEEDVADLALDASDLPSASPAAPSTEETLTESRLEQSFSLKALTLATHQVEVLFVLCALLGDTHKAEYLRLIQNFCDRDGNNTKNKRLMLSAAELRVHHLTPEEQLAEEEAGTSSSEETTKPGLMTKILGVLMREPADSMFRFWLASCVEAFLRGSHQPDQAFVAASGFMHHLLDEILRGGFKCSVSLQIHFDLLGELLKFNRKMFTAFDHLLEGSKFDRLIEVTVTHLVDSNVFLRSAMLSLQRFASAHASGSDESAADTPGSPSTSASAEDAQQSGRINDRICSSATCAFKLAAFLECNWQRLLRDLMCVVDRQEINQENICVINTALVFLIFAQRGGRLAHTLHVLRASETGAPGGPNIIGNFRSLLEFWVEYYSSRGGPLTAT
eukprot:gene6645-7956_t